MKGSFLFGIALLMTATATATTFKGKIKDSVSGEEIIGASIVVKEDPTKGTVSGLDGSFSITADNNCTLICTYVGYKTVEIKVTGKENNILIPLESDDILLEGVTIIASNPGKTEAGARGIEKQAMNVVNVMSAKAIELSPDITVANVIQRMSGVTIERNSSGEGQYAILRGMDKRYNYTLINGVKIPSPDNKNRFVPLDIFPSELLDRLEVTKSLTANMEGDGIGGAVNLIMKDAPTERQFTVNLSSGYNALYFDHDFCSFNHKAIQKKSPNEINGTDYAVKASDFTSENLRMSQKHAFPDLTGGISYGDRFLDERLGVILAANLQNTYRGKESSLIYEPGSTYTGTTERLYTEQQTRFGGHLKFDYNLNRQNKLTWYNGYMDMQSAQVRDEVNPQWEQIRMKWNRQSIINSTLKGEHCLSDNGSLKINWSAVASKAWNETPDNAQIYLTTAKNGLQTVSVNPAATRRWEHNSDRDLAGYLDISYNLKLNTVMSLDISAGGMYRDKQRSSFFNEYTFTPISEQRSQVRGEDWNNFDEIKLEPSRSYGNLSDPLNYDASEKVGAGYGMLKYTVRLLEIIAGVRVEHTNQGYLLKFATENSDPEGNQTYTDVLPDLHIKYQVHKNANLRFSYAKSINRPSFFEIVPYNILNEEYKECGNPDLKHTVADNIDIRYEFFPKSSEQFMIGLFYKNIQDPIEYGLISQGQDTYLTPMNWGNAQNYGVEIDIMKYFNWFGIKANYTYTHSNITTEKRDLVASDPDDETNTQVVGVEQTRPLYGQAAHVANLSLLFKPAQSGWEGQLSASYTGKRLSSISRWINNDIWEDGYMQLDASIEKNFKKGISLFAKASNLLNTPLLRFIPGNPRVDYVDSEIERYKGGVLERRDYHGQTFLIGIRYKL